LRAKVPTWGNCASGGKGSFEIRGGSGAGREVEGEPGVVGATVGGEQAGDGDQCEVVARNMTIAWEMNGWGVSLRSWPVRDSNSVAARGTRRGLPIFPGGR
jgi:hypothetical protein